MEALALNLFCFHDGLSLHNLCNSRSKRNNFDITILHRLKREKFVFYCGTT